MKKCILPVVLNVYWFYFLDILLSCTSYTAVCAIHLLRPVTARHRGHEITRRQTIPQGQAGRLSGIIFTM